MPKPVGDVGEGHEDASGSGVYCFIRELIVEGKDARFVNKKGRYVINWSRALKCYHNYKSKRNPQYKSKNINRRKASNGLRAALLNFYKKEGAKEYKDCKKVNEKDEVVERQFQMPPRVFESLFGSNVHLSDDSSEHETSSIASEADEKPLATPSSSDTGFDDAMDICDDAEPSSEGLPTGDLLCSNVKTEEDQVNPSDITPPCQMFGIDLSQEDLDSALGEICSSSDNDVDLLGVVRDICPSSGSVKGGLQFYISLTEELSEDDIYCIARFDGIGDVSLERLNCYTLAGIIPASQQPGPVPVTVNTQDGRLLGKTCFLYVDEIQEVLTQLVDDPALQSLYFAMWSQQHGSFGSHGNNAQIMGSFTLQDQGSSIQGTHAQGLKVLQLLVYTAAKTNAQQFIQMIFSTSAGRLVFNAYKGQPQLPEDVARANGHDDLAQYLQDVTTRLSKESSSDAEPNAIDWLELVEAVNKIQKQSSVNEDETDPESGHSKDEDNQSDYFADAETSSCGSFELEIGCSDSEDGEGLNSKNGEEHKQPDVESSPSKNVTSFEVPAEVKAQLDNDLDLEDDKNYEEPTTVNSKPTLNLPSVMFRPPRKRRKAAASTQEGACMKETSKTHSIFQIRGGTQSKNNTSEREQEARTCLSQEKCTQLKNLDVVQEEKEDDKNYEEPSSFSSKSSWNFFNGYGFFGWLNKWRSGDATTSSLQGEGVNRTQETLQRETVGCPQKRKNTNDREEEARRVPSQVKTTKLKRTRKWLKGDDHTTSSQQGANVKETQKVQSFGEGISTESGTQKSENANVRKPSQAKRRAQRSQWSPFRRPLLRNVFLLTTAVITVLCLVTGIKLGERQLLHWAVRNGNIRISQALMNFVSNVDAPNIYCETTLHVAAKNGYKDLAGLLMKLGNNASSKDHQQHTPLHLAALSGSHEIADALIRQGSNLNARNHLKQTAVHLASLNGHRNVLEVLLQHGSDVNVWSKDGLTPLHLAALNGHRNVLEVLLQHGSDVNVWSKDGLTPLHLASWNGHRNILEVLLQHGSDVNAWSKDGFTPLHLAALNGYKNVAEVLIRYGSDVNVTNYFGLSPLHWAAESGHRKITEFLIQHGSDVMAQDALHETALHLAARYGKKNVAEVLIRYGSDVNARNKDELTPLHLAAFNGHKNVAEVLIRYGSDVNVAYYLGQSLLHWAAESGHQDITEFLIQRGSDVMAQNDFHETALHLATRYGKKNVAEVLIRYGSDVNVTDYLGQSPLHRAAENGHQEITEFLIQHGSDVMAQDDFHETALHLAARYGKKKVAEVLIRYGSDVNIWSKDGLTPLHLAALNGHKNVAEVLRQRHFEINFRDKALGGRDAGTAYLGLGLVTNYQGRCETSDRVNYGSKYVFFSLPSCTVCPTISTSNRRPKDSYDNDEKTSPHWFYFVNKCVKNDASKVLTHSKLRALLKENANERHPLEQSAEFLHLLKTLVICIVTHWTTLVACNVMIIRSCIVCPTISSSNRRPKSPVFLRMLKTLVICIVTSWTTLVTRSVMNARLRLRNAHVHKGIYRKLDSFTYAEKTTSSSSGSREMSPSPVRKGCEDGNFTERDEAWQISMTGRTMIHLKSYVEERMVRKLYGLPSHPLKQTASSKQLHSTC